jgi:TonB family protein
MSQGCFFLAPRNLTAQTETKDPGIKGQVVLSKLFPPVYPPLARQALVFGNVHLRISVRSDGSIDSVDVIDGHRLLQRAVLDSARHSQFECKDCGGSGLSQSFTYSFRLPPERQENPDPCCCSHEPGSPGYKGPGGTVSQSDERITVIAPPVCMCPDACTVAWAEEHSPYRSARCLYLWKRRHRHISIQ